MLAEELFGEVKKYIEGHRAQPGFQAALGLSRDAGQPEIGFLAQGEYNLNYWVKFDGQKYVLRINTGSQMLLPNQIGYEYKALQLLSRSGVTPGTYFLDDTKQELPYGLLIMEYMEGEPLDYRCDLDKAAGTLARVHGIDFTAAEVEFLVKEPGPFTGIYNEVSRLLNSYFNCPQAEPESVCLLERIFMMAEAKKQEEKYFLAEPWLRVINTELNSHNFIVNQQSHNCILIDWEKPIYGEPAQDLSMFLIPTTTYWKRDYILSQEEEQAFLKAYLNELPPCSQAATLQDRVNMFKFFNLLRAVSWCAMAWTEYIRPDRLLSNDDTFRKIEKYIEPEFLTDVFKSYLK